ncbi:hypothetical protein CPB85DRAFT_1438539 [Mucidula mucida]|nr:hypothetical protein CPB85DRAFT_1438539 [Mucidula mucida]
MLKKAASGVASPSDKPVVLDHRQTSLAIAGEIGGRFEETAIDGESSDEGEEEQDAEPPKKRCQVTKAVRDQVKTRTHQKTFLESLQATPAVLHQNSDTKRCFDDDGRFAWLQHETYIKADAIEDCIVVCGCCSEAQVSESKAKKGKPT